MQTAQTPPAIVMPDLRNATRGVIEECTNELDAAGPRTTALTFLVDLGNQFTAVVRCTRTKKDTALGVVHAAVSITHPIWDQDK
jgi:hypothetical protein